MQKDDILAAQGLARIQDELQALMADSIRVTTHPADVPTGHSRFGGWPDLPDGVQWPQLKGKPLAFIAQFNLAETHPFDTQNLLPASGMLYFFYDAAGDTYGEKLEDRGGWAVFYDEGKTLKPAQADLPEDARFHACAVDFLREATLPLRPDVFGRGSNWTSEEHAAYEVLMSSQRGIQNRLLGHADAIQDDMHIQAHLLGSGKPLDTPVTDENQQAARDWVLLFQADSDPNAGMRWGNSGRLYFWIEQKALQARQFDRVWAILQSE